MPGEVLIAFWAFETDFGKNMGDFETIPSLATLAWDCRRPDKFREQLIGALRLYDNGDLDREDMRGAWAGEIGHTQFLPKEYFETAVDFDGDGHRNLAQVDARCHGLGRGPSGQARLAGQPALDRGSDGAQGPALGPGRHRHPACRAASG